MPVEKLNIVRVLLLLATNLDWILLQLNTKNAFLNGKLDEVFMTLPSDFCEQRKENMACKLKKSLYGLKHSSMAWFDRFA